MAHFIKDNLSLRPAKLDFQARPSIPSERKVTKDDINEIRSSLIDIQSYLRSDVFANGKNLGVKGDGVTDDTAALQAAINATAGRTLVLPKGKYTYSSTLVIDDRMHHIVGEFGGRYSEGGTELVYTGTGPAIQIGTDDGVNWDASHYGGGDSEQDQVIENLWISHASPATSLAGGGQYKAGAYGIWDWYGGQLVLRNVGIEKFEANFVGIQSDIDSFEFLLSLYSKYGLYFGPRSDQATISRLYSFGCDRAVTVDRANGLRLIDPQLVGCGSATVSAIEVRRGSGRVSIVRPWLESFNGYSGTDQISYVSAGEVDGYGAGGSISSPGGSPTTSACSGVHISDPLVYGAAAAQAYHTKYLATVGKCQRFVLDHPIAPVGSSLSNLDALIAVPAAQTPTNADTQIAILGVSSDASVASMFTNLGAGDPAWHIASTGASGRKFSGYGVTTIEGDATLSKDDAGSHANRPSLTVSNTNGGAFDHRAAVLLSGKDTGGTIRTVSIQAEGGFLTLATANNKTLTLDAGTGQARSLSQFSVTKSLLATNEIAPTQITANQNDYNPTGFADATVAILTSDAARDITGFASEVAGRIVYVFNNGGFNITLKHQVTSTATRQIIGRGAADTVLTPKTGTFLYYSPSLTKWLVMADSL